LPAKQLVSTTKRTVAPVKGESMFYEFERQNSRQVPCWG